MVDQDSHTFGQRRPPVGKMMYAEPHPVGVCSPRKCLQFTCIEVASGGPKMLENSY